MIAYYLKTAARTLGKYRFHSAVSLISLTLAFVCFIAANVLAGYLLSWDRHFPDSERIFTVNTSGPQPRTDGVPFVPRHLAAHLESEFPEIEHVTTHKPAAEYNVTTGDVTDSLQITFVEGDYLRIFPLPLLPPGDRLADLPPDTVLITESAALARFGTTDVVGRRVVIGQRLELAIAGVVQTMARPSHLKGLSGNGTDLIAPMRAFDELGRGTAGSGQAENWHDQSFGIYVEFASAHPLDVAGYNQRLMSFSERRVPLRYYLSGPHQTTFSFRPIEENGPSQLKLLFGDADVTTLLVLSGFLVLLVASLNYSNLVIAQLTQRSHEIAVQKVVGARRRQLMLQYSLESLLVAGLAFLAALAVCGFVLSNSDVLRAKGFHAGLLLRADLWLTAAAGLFVVTVVAGAYPALRITRRSLSGMLRPAGSSGYSHRLRSLMVGTQFAVSSALLILTMFIFNQNSTMVSEAGNEIVDPVLVLRNLMPETEDELDLLEAGLRRSTHIEATTRSKLVPQELASVETVALGLTPDPAGHWVPLNRITVAHDFFETMEIPVLAGRTFSRDIAADLYPSPEDVSEARGPYSVVIDAATAARLGLTPEQAVGESVYTAYMPPVVAEPRFLQLTVVGVVGNRALEIAAVGYAPTHLFTLSPGQASNLIVRPDASAIPDALEDIDRVFGRFYPGVRARPEFLDEIFRRNFALIQVFGSVIGAFALFSFGISSVGLTGIATFITAVRQREVGIRRILGASRREIMRMLLMSFSKPVLIANLVAWPIGFVLASAYLSIFYVQVPVTLIPFVLSLALTLGVAALAVVHQARRSSRVRPAAVLRHE